MRYLSLFSGIEAATVAWHPLGWECVGVAELEPFPCSVLAHYYPHTPNLGDVTKITESMIAALGPIDVVVFGSPCQDLSVAGKRKGLEDADGQLTRSGLFHIAIDIIEWAREHCGTRFALWENVPGAFSSNKGHDFAVVVGELAGAACDVPPKGWGNEGCFVGEKAMVEWSTLDAQWFGVAQRRRRVFALADFGDWRGRCPVLLEPEGMRGDSAPRREAGQGVAGSLEARATGGGFPGTDGAAAGHVVATGSELGVAGALDTQCGGGKLTHQFLVNGHVLPVMGTLTARMFNALGARDVEEGALVAHSLRADGFDASEDGTGRGTPLIPVAHVETVPTMQTGSGHEAGHGARSGDTKDAYIVPMAFVKGTNPHSAEEAPTFREAEIAATLNGWDERHDPPKHMAVQSMQVRRLTPRECERLQGFPDDYTLVPIRNKPAADGPRYKALGNSMAVPVMRWIGRQLDLVRLFQ